MFPLQLSRIFDYQQPDADAYRMDDLRAAPTEGQTTAVSTLVLENRRKVEDRRNDDRRLMQQAIFLNTRKAQGRRRSLGRRASDMENLTQYRPISLKG